MWVRVAKMHFTHAAKRWYPSVESQLQTANWPTFTRLILDRFGQDEHELLLRQLFQIHQINSIQEHIDQFIVIVDDLSAYSGTIDSLYYAMRFIDGLKDYIRAAVALHHPKIWILLASLLNYRRSLTLPRRGNSGVLNSQLDPDHMLRGRFHYLIHLLASLCRHLR